MSSINKFGESLKSHSKVESKNVFTEAYLITELIYLQFINVINLKTH